MIKEQERKYFTQENSQYTQINNEEKKRGKKNFFKRTKNEIRKLEGALEIEDEEADK